MDERDNNRYRSGAASRPPESELTEDTPLFTDIPYTPVRRAGNNGRPSSSSRGGKNANDSTYGRRIYSAPARPSAASSGQKGSRTQQPRTAPVYTELSWDDLMRGTDRPDPRSSRNDRGQGAFYSNTANTPQTRSGSQYFGGFDQEMEELFYSRSPEGPVQPGERNGAAAQASPAAAAPRADYIRPKTPAYRPQTTVRSTAPAKDNTPAPSQRSAASRGRPQWNSVFGNSYGRNPPPPAKRPAPAPAEKRSTAPDRSTPQTRTRRSGPSGRRSSGRIPTLSLGVGMALLVLLIFVIARLTGADTATTRPASVPANMSTALPAESPEPKLTPEPAADTTPTPTPAPSPTPSGPKAKKVGELVVPADWGPVIPTRSRTVYDSYFDRTCMIGNSLVEGFMMWSGMTNMRYISNTGVTVTDAIGKLDLAPLTLNPAGYYDNIYLMFGLNEIGTDVNSFVQGYKKLVDYIRQYQPAANIVCISVTPVTRQVDGDPNEVQKMDRIRTFNSALQEFCVDQNCWYLDIYNLLLDKDGYLSGDYAFVGDGKHFEKSGYVAWANYMKTHYVDEKLLTE